MKCELRYIDFIADAGGFISRDMIRDKKYAQVIFFDSKELGYLKKLLTDKENFNNIGEIKDFRLYISINGNDIYVTRLGRVDNAGLGQYVINPLSFLMLNSWLEKQKINGLNPHLKLKIRQ